jgi:hypothetical protein
MMLQKTGKNNFDLLLLIVLTLICFYFIYVLYIFPINARYALTYATEKPIFILFPKCGYAILLIIGILTFYKEKNISWFLINLSSMGILFFWYSQFVYVFYDTMLNMFFLEFIAIFMIVLTNRKTWVKQHQITRSKVKLILLIVIPLIFVVLNEIILYFNIDYSIIQCCK